MSRKSAITVTRRADAVKTTNAALARRLAGNPHGAGSRQVPIKDASEWQTYIENTYNNANAFYEMKERGWVPMLPADLACPVEDSGFQVSPDGYLVRGPQGQEMLFKMAASDYALLMAAKTRVNLQGIGSASKIRTDMAEAASKQLGSEAADYIHDLPGQVVDTLAES